jgi:hypothetical protein
MLPPEDEIPAIEAPLVLLLLFLVAAPLIFFGVRYEWKVRTANEARAKREITYQEVLRSHAQVLKPGMKRGEVERYLRAKNVEFQRWSLDDVIKIGEGEAPGWFCGAPTVNLEFQFTAAAQSDGHPDEASNSDTLGEIKMLRMEDGCT